MAASLMYRQYLVALMYIPVSCVAVFVNHVVPNIFSVAVLSSSEDSLEDFESTSAVTAIRKSKKRSKKQKNKGVLPACFIHTCILYFKENFSLLRPLCLV
jgi:hypothetical protein